MPPSSVDDWLLLDLQRTLLIFILLCKLPATHHAARGDTAILTFQAPRPDREAMLNCSNVMAPQSSAVWRSYLKPFVLLRSSAISSQAALPGYYPSLTKIRA